MGLFILSYFRIFITGILLFVIIFSLLKKNKILSENDSINSLVALLAAIIVSMSGIVAYSVSYSINWFIILFFILFLIIFLLAFIGIDFKSFFSGDSNSLKSVFLWSFIILFSIILIKSFFVVNNYFGDSGDVSNNGSFYVNTSPNYGVGDFVSEETKDSFKSHFYNIDHDTFGAVIFLAGLGLFIMLMK